MFFFLNPFFLCFTLEEIFFLSFLRFLRAHQSVLCITTLMHCLLPLLFKCRESGEKSLLMFLSFLVRIERVIDLPDRDKDSLKGKNSI